MKLKIKNTTALDLLIGPLVRVKNQSLKHQYIGFAYWVQYIRLKNELKILVHWFSLLDRSKVGI